MPLCAKNSLVGFIRHAFIEIERVEFLWKVSIVQPTFIYNARDELTRSTAETFVVVAAGAPFTNIV